MERGVTTIATYNKDPIPFNQNLHTGSGTIQLHQARLTGFRRVVLEWRQQFCQMEGTFWSHSKWTTSKDCAKYVC